MRRELLCDLVRICFALLLNWYYKDGGRLSFAIMLMVLLMVDDYKRKRIKDCAHYRYFHYFIYLALVLPTRIVTPIFLIPWVRLSIHPHILHVKKLYNPISQDGLHFIHDVKLDLGVKYGEHYREYMDVIVPMEMSASHAGFGVVFIHGGGNVAFESLIQIHQATPIARGVKCKVFCLTYPLAPENHHPFSLISTLRALIFIRDQYKIERVAILGESGGSLLASLATILVSNPIALNDFNERFHIAGENQLVSKSFPKIQAFIGWSSILDRKHWLSKGSLSFLLEFALHMLYGFQIHLEEEEEEESFLTLHDSLSYVDKATFPPTLLICGNRDFFGLHHSHVEMVRLLREKGVVVESHSPDASHGFFGPPMVTMNWEAVAKVMTKHTVDFIIKEKSTITIENAFHSPPPVP